MNQTSKAFCSRISGTILRLSVRLRYKKITAYVQNSSHHRTHLALKLKMRYLHRTKTTTLFSFLTIQPRKLSRTKSYQLMLLTSRNQWFNLTKMNLTLITLRLISHLTKVQLLGFMIYSILLQMHSNPKQIKRPNLKKVLHLPKTTKRVSVKSLKIKSISKILQRILIKLTTTGCLILMTFSSDRSPQTQSFRVLESKRGSLW